MKLAHLLLTGLLCSLLGSSPVRADEAQASVYVVDRSAQFADTSGACLPYTPLEKTGPSREILGIAKGPPGSTLFMMAFDRDQPYLGLAPVIEDQTEDSKPTRFPAEGSVWPFEKPGRAIELYIAVFDQADPQLAKLVEYGEWLKEAIAKNEEVEALLHAEVILKRLSNILRQRSVEDYRVKFGDELTALRLPPASKAAVARGGNVANLASQKREPSASIAAVRRGMKTLDDEWRKDSRTISFGLGTPGVLVFPVTTPPLP